jgi:ubiquinol-cytochrome c reductase iron-sulfur subunit
MSEQATPPAPTRRNMLSILAGSWAVAGGTIALWPLVDQFNPDADTVAVRTDQLLDIDLKAIVAGDAMTFAWFGKPVFIRHRTLKEIEAARADDTVDLPDRLARNAALSDTNAPATDANRVTSGHPEWIVVIGSCTQNDCIPYNLSGGGLRGDYGGWLCPCCGSQYDLSGRIRKGPAPSNLAVPPYTFVSNSRMSLG